jgi:formyltetrahydrofolate synthetase
MSSCVAERICDRDEAQTKDVPSWEVIVATIRAVAANGDAASAAELYDWAEFVEGCGELRQKR